MWYNKKGANVISVNISTCYYNLCHETRPVETGPEPVFRFIAYNSTDLPTLFEVVQSIHMHSSDIMCYKD